jgi:hypothetical protein
MGNVAFSHEERRFGIERQECYYEKCRFGPQQISPTCGQYEAQNGNYLALDHRTRVYHGKCRFEP